MTVQEFKQKLNTDAGRLELAKGWADYISQEIGIADIFYETEYIENINKCLPKSFSLYNDNRNKNVVMDVKRRGSPDFEDIEKKLGIQIDDENMGGIWQDEINLFIQILDKDIFPNDNIVIVGRSGGYWGFYLTDSEYYSLLDWDKEKLIPILNNGIKESKNEILAVIKIEFPALNQNYQDNDFYLEIETVIYDKINKTNECYKLSGEWAEKLSKFESVMNDQIKEFESVAYWVNFFEENPSLLAGNTE